MRTLLDAHAALPLEKATYSLVAENFSLTRGGPIYRLQCRMDAARDEGVRVARRAVLAVVLTWLPLLFLSAVQGLALGKDVPIPFLQDFAVNVRLLIALPLLIISEVAIDHRFRTAVKHFLKSGLVTETTLPAFEGAIEKVTRLRDHLLPEITPHIGLYEDPDDTTVTDPLGDYLDSLERVGRLAPAEVLPAHQHVFTDAPSRVAELLAHHEERLTGLLTLLSVPLTPWQLAERMEWNRPWADIPYGSRNIAVSEAEAHLRRLVKLGRAEAVAGSDPVTYVAV